MLRDALLPAVAGVAIGAGASVWWAQTLRAVLYGVEPYDPGVLFIAAALVLAIVVVASIVPASAAAGTDPMRTLRAE